MNKIIYFFAMLPLAIFLAGCSGGRDLAYFADAQRGSAQAAAPPPALKVQVGDLLHIYVTSSEPASVLPFNQETNRLIEGVNAASGGSAGESASAIGYRVNEQGDIAFPVTGDLHVEGMAMDSLCRYIESLLRERQLVADPQVTARLMNFRVAVLGEVASPGWVPAGEERLTLLEVIARAGDLTLTGVRDNVCIVRQESGEVTIGTVDLTSKELFNSPYYYMRQNDVVIVEPNLKRRREYSHNDQLMNYIQFGLTIGTFTSSTAHRVMTYLLDRKR